MLTNFNKLPLIIMVYLFAICLPKVIAQVSVLPNNNSQINQLRDLFPIEIKAEPGLNYILIIEVSGKFGVVVRGESPIVAMKSNMFSFGVNYLNQFNWIYSNTFEGEVLSKSSKLPEGNYYTTWILSTPEGIEVARVSKSLLCQTNSSSMIKGRLGNDKISFSGSAQVNIEYGSRPQMYSNYPNWSVVTSISPSLNVYEVPVYANILYSNITTRNHQSPIIYSFGYDNEAFKRVLVQRLKKTIDSDKLKNEFNKNKDHVLSELKTYNQVINSPEFIKEYNQVLEVENLQSEYKSINRLLSIDTDSLTEKDLLNLKSIIPDSLKEPFDVFLECKTSNLDSCNEFTRSFEHYKKSDSYVQKINNLKDSLEQIYDTYSDVIPKIDSYKNIIKNRDIQLDKATLNGWIAEGVDPNSINIESHDLESIDIGNTDNLINKLENLKILKKYEKYLLYLKSIQFGTIIKKNSDFTLNNMPINGIGIEIAPKNIYFSFMYGQILKPVYSVNIDQTTYKRNYISGTIGYGLKGANYIHFTVNHSKDNPNSLLPRDSVLMYFRKPGQNNQLSVDFSWYFFKKKFRIYGELAGSQFIRDLTFIGNDNILNDSLNLESSRNWFVNIFKQKPINFNTSVDFAFRFYTDINLFKGKSKLVLGTERVGPNFYSFGNPYLLKDMFILDANLTQTLLKGKLRIRGGVKRFSDNLRNSSKLVTTSQLRWHADIELKLPKFPTLKITYMPIIQQNDSGLVNMNMGNIMSSYNLKFKKLTAIYTLGYIYQNGNISYGYGSFESQSLLFNQMYSLGSKFNLFNANSIIYSVSQLGKVLSYNLSAGVQLQFKKYNINLNSNALYNKLEYRLGGGLGSSFSLSKYLNWNIQLEYFYYQTNRIENIYYPQYDRISLRSIWNINW